jgi:hypothetical protein
MNYQTMQFQAREKHRRLRQEGRHHRLTRQAKTGKSDPIRSHYTSKLTAAFAGLATAAANVIAPFL